MRMGVGRGILCAENQVKMQLEGKRNAGRQDFFFQTRVGRRRKGGRMCEERKQDAITEQRYRKTMN